MNKKASLLALVILFATSTFAQKKIFEDVKGFELRNVGNIMDKETLLGYYFFYKKDKVDRKTEAFEITLMDNNLNVMKSFDVQRPKDSRLVETSFNGTSFVMVYFHKKELEFVTYDKAGKKLGSKLYEDLPSYQRAAFIASETTGQDVKSFYVMDSTSYLRYTPVKNKKMGYELEAFSNSMKTLWKGGSSSSSEQTEIADIQYTSQKYIASIIGRTKKKDMESFYQILDAKTGKKIFETPMKENGSELSALNIFVDEARERSIILGEYYAPGQEIANSKSMGLYAMYIDMEGNKSGYKKYSWKGDLAKIMDDIDEDNKSKTHPSIFFHKVYRSKTGKAIAIGEQYKRVASASGIANMALAGLGGGTSNQSTTDFKVMNMIVLEFDSSNNITNSFSAKKKSHNIAMPMGFEFYPLAMVANIMNYWGAFDFEFASVDKARDRVYAVYKDFNRKEDDSKGSEKSDVMLGVVSYEGGKSKADRVPINTDAKYIWIAPAKPGYITIGEYFKKEKKVSYRLEKISN